MTVEHKEYLTPDDFPELDCSEESGFCVSASDLKHTNAYRRQKGKPALTQLYDDWEDKVATPFLKSKGYTVGRWYTSEGDSFGPLTRAVRVVKDGQRSTFWYG